METVFLLCAIVGGIMMLSQLGLSLLGFVGDSDVDVGDHDFDVGDHDFDVGDHDFGAGDHDLDAVDHDLGGDHEAGHVEHGSNFFFQMLSLRSAVAAVTFFGLVGMSVISAGGPVLIAFPVALCAGMVAMVVVAWLMRMLHTLYSEGNVRIELAVGSVGRVYLTVPPNNEGAGQVTVKLQERTMEYKAVTKQSEPFKTGTNVVVLGVVGPDTVEIGPLRQ